MNKQVDLIRSAVLASVLVAAGAWAQPQTVSFTGNLTNTMGPVSGSHSFIFTLYDAATGGTASWSETHTLTADNGLVFVELGNTTPLTPAIFTGATRYLQVTVDSVPMTPRSPVVSVPYAIRAAVANTAETLGTLLPSDVQRRVTGTCAGANAVQTIAADGTVTCVSIAGGTGDITSVNTPAGSGLIGGGTTGDVTLSLANCTTGQVLKHNGTNWACAADIDTDTDTTYTAGNGLLLSGTTFSLNSAGCLNGYVLKSNGAGAWTCQADTDTNSTYVAGNGLVLSGNSFSLNSVGCANGYVLKSNGAGGWSCQADTDTDTTYTAGAGLALVGGSFSLNSTGCVNGYVLKSNGAGSWSCQADSNSTYTAGAGLTLAGSSFSIGTGAITNTMLQNSSVTISATAPLQAGGAVSLGGTTSLQLQTCGAGQILKMNAGGTAWNCGADIDTDTDTTYTAGAGLQLTGTTFSLNTGGCVAGEILKWNGAAWNCVVDDNTTYGASSPITLSAGNFGLANCAGGGILKMNAGGTAWTCATDNDTVYTNAMAVAAVQAQTVVHANSFGPTEFMQANLDGVAMNCALPSTFCLMPTAVTSNLYLPLRISAPANVTDVICRVLDSDTTAGITMTLYNGSGSVASASTVGSVGIQDLTLSGLNQAINGYSRGPVLVVNFGAASLGLRIYECQVIYTTNGL